ncbi:MAG: hypothetical protein ACI9UA_002549 [Pseudoalteromonas tetraodonis]|jgi:uncharacterized protein (DUF58 family)
MPDQPSYMALLPEEATASLARLEFLARGKKLGGINGRHNSPKKGTSVEFAEHRQYTQGDDLRNLDWRAYGKSDRYYIKQYAEETNLRATIVLDASGSMAYRGDLASKVNGNPVSKFEQGRYLAAALAHLFSRQQDATGLVTFDTKIISYHRAAARQSQTHQILTELYKTEPSGETALAPILHEVAERIPQRGLVILISDLFDDPAEILEALHHFRYRNHELVIFHTMAEEELSFPFKKFSKFSNLENRNQRIRVEPETIRATYLEKIRAFIEQISSGCGKLHADYVPLNTKQNYEQVISNYLSQRR